MRAHPFRPVFVALTTLLTLLALAPLASAQEALPRLEFAGGRAGVGFYQPHQWGLLSSRVQNPTDHDATPLLSLSLGNDAKLQFCSALWLPPRSQRTILTPVYTLTLPAKSEQGIRVLGRLVGERETLLGMQEGLLVSRESTFDTALMQDADDRAAAEASSALREAAGLGPATAYISEDSAPPMVAAWGAIDGFVVSQWSPRLEPAQVEALRHWVLAGGRLWIMLDQVDANWVQRLLGDAWDVAVVDRVRLTEFSIDSTEDKTSHSVQSDYPVEMVRVLAPADAKVMHTVQGYPASMWQAVGRGGVMVTTVHASAWLTGEKKEQAAAPLKDLTFFTRGAKPRESAVVASGGSGGASGGGGAVQAEMAAFEKLVRNQIGYTIMGRGPVVAVLGLFALALLGTGLLLARRDRLELIAVVGIALAAVAAAVLIGYGLARQSERPLMIAAAQLVRTSDRQPYAEVSSLVEIYNPPMGGAPQSVPLQGDQAGVAWPAGVEQMGLVRLVWNDLHRWQFPEMSLPPGAVRRLWTHRMEPMPAPAKAVMQFGPAGLSGQVAAEAFAPLTDAVIATPYGHMTTQIAPDGTLSASAADVLRAGQFIRTDLGVLGQTQINRQEVYRQLLADGTFLDQPMLLGWSTGQSTGLGLGEGEPQRRTQTLVALPIRFERPTAGTQVTVPGMFMPREGFTGAGSQYRPTIYDPAHNNWIPDISYNNAFLMRFELPASLRPMTLESATLTIDLFAPGWQCEVLHYTNGKVEAMPAQASPLGLMTVTLKGADLPSLLDDGSVAVGLRVSSIDSTATKWTIKTLDLTVTGTVGAEP